MVENINFSKFFAFFLVHFLCFFSGFYLGRYVEYQKLKQIFDDLEDTQKKSNELLDKLNKELEETEKQFKKNDKF